MRSIRSVFNSLARFKAATLLNILGLTVAFASFLIIMMQVRQELTFDKHYPDAERIFQLERNAEPDTKNSPQLPRPLIEQLFTQLPDMEWGAYRHASAEVSVYDAEKGFSSAIAGLEFFKASDDYPEVFGLTAVSGSFDGFNRGKTSILSQSVARRIFGEQDPVGRMLVAATGMYADTAEVIAVYKDLPRNASQSNGIIGHIGTENQNRMGNWNYSTFLKLKNPRVAVETEMILNDLFKTRFPGSYIEGHRMMRLTNLADRYFSPDNADHKKGNLTTVYSLLGVAVLILLVAMINFVNFSMALIPRRIRSINTRKVLGSSSASIRGGQIAEACGITIISYGLALFVVYLLSTSNFASLLDADMRLTPNLPLLWGTLGIAVVTGILAAVYPAFYSTSFSAALVLKGSFGFSAQGRKLRTALIGFQYVISMALIIVALFVHVQHEYMRGYDVGMNRENILTAALSHKMTEQKQSIVNKLKSNPDIEEVAFAWSTVIDPRMGWKRSYRDDEIGWFASIPVSPEFLSVMGIPVVEGRDFLEGDDLQETQTYIFNEAAQKQYGLQVGETVDNRDPIVGIVRDFNFRPLHYPVGPIAFVNFGTNAWGPLSHIYVRVDPQNALKAQKFITETLLEFDPDCRSILQVSFLDDSIGAQYKKERNLALLITLFSLLAVLISTVGAFGLILFETQYRRKEIGLRKVFGATVNEILTMFNRRYVWIVGVCFVIAAPIAYYAATRWQNNFAYKAPVAIWIFAAALFIVLLITVATVTLQSYRAATENPANSIRTE